MHRWRGGFSPRFPPAMPTRTTLCAAGASPWFATNPVLHLRPNFSAVRNIRCSWELPMLNCHPPWQFSMGSCQLHRMFLTIHDRHGCGAADVAGTLSPGGAGQEKAGRLAGTRLAFWCAFVKSTHADAVTANSAMVGCQGEGWGWGEGNGGLVPQPIH